MRRVVVLLLVVAACGPSANAVDCLDRWNATVAAGDVTAPAGAVSAAVGFQAAHNWEGGTDVCWLAITIASVDRSACHRFSFDVDGTWLPPEWVDGGSEPGRCFDHPDGAIATVVGADGTLERG